MAITVTQEPNDYNLAYQSNVFTLSGLTTEDEYVINILDEDLIQIASIRQPANPAGVAHFDIQRILQAQLGTYPFIEETSQVSPYAGQAFDYFIEYGTVTGNAVTIENTTDKKNIINGYDNWRNINWNSTSYIYDADLFSCAPPQSPTLEAQITDQSQFTVDTASFTIDFTNTSVGNLDLDISVNDTIQVTLQPCGGQGPITELCTVTAIDSTGYIVTFNYPSQAFEDLITCLSTTTVGYVNGYIQVEVPINYPNYVNTSATREYEFLTNFPKETFTLRESSYHTLSFFNRIKDYQTIGLTSDNNNVIQPAFVKIDLYDAADNVIQNILYSIDDTTGLGPRANFDSTVIPLNELDEIIGNVGVGPQNLIDAGYWVASTAGIWNLITQTWGNVAVNWEAATTQAIVKRYEVQIWSIDMCYAQDNGMPVSNAYGDLLPYLNAPIYTAEFNIDASCRKFDPITLSFVNQYGVKDYFTFEARNTWRQNISRDEYYKDNKSWSSATFEVDQYSGGSTVFSTEIETSMTLASYWLDDDVSKWLEELYSSPSVMVYYEGVWEPATITSRRYDQKTYRRDKLFQHEIQIKFANNKRVQRG